MPRTRRPKPPARIHANLTPLIDVTFLLIVFFILVAQITNSQIIDNIKLPQPENAVSIEPSQTENPRLTLNVLPPHAPDALGNRPPTGYRLGSQDYPPTATGIKALTTALTAAKQQNPNLIIDFRADVATPYQRIFPALDATSRAGINHLNLRVQASDQQPRTTNRNGG